MRVMATENFKTSELLYVAAYMHSQVDKSIPKNHKDMVPQKTDLKVAMAMVQGSISLKMNQMECIINDNK